MRCRIRKSEFILSLHPSCCPRSYFILLLYLRSQFYLPHHSGWKDYFVSPCHLLRHYLHQQIYDTAHLHCKYHHLNQHLKLPLRLRLHLRLSHHQRSYDTAYLHHHYHWRYHRYYQCFHYYPHYLHYLTSHHRSILFSFSFSSSLQLLSDLILPMPLYRDDCINIFVLKNHGPNEFQSQLFAFCWTIQ